MALDMKLIEETAELLIQRRPAVALTGAGISVESGIPDFRSAGGLWDKFDPMEYATITAFETEPERVWTMILELEATLGRARPNRGHDALARLEEGGLLQGIVTQNIDNLHQEAGSREVIEFHGNGRRLKCLDCELDLDPATTALDRVDGIPRCPTCRAILKPDIVFFGDAIPELAFTRAYELAARCGTMLIVGTSATVMPAAALPLIAKQHGASLIEINLERTELSHAVDVTLLGKAGKVLPALTEAVLARLPS
jgi:NAD-dependent deacetylase